MRREKNQKARQQTRHAKRRAFERYKLDLNDSDLLSLAKDIQNGRATHIFKQSQRVSIFRMMCKNTDVQVVYDGQRKTIVTFIPLDESIADCA